MTNAPKDVSATETPLDRAIAAVEAVKADFAKVEPPNHLNDAFRAGLHRAVQELESLRAAAPPSPAEKEPLVERLRADADFLESVKQWVDPAHGEPSPAELASRIRRAADALSSPASVPPDYERLKQQALVISEICREAGVGAMPLDSAVLELARRPAASVGEPPPFTRAIAIKAMTALSYGAGNSIETKEKILREIYEMCDPPAATLSATDKERP